VDPVPDSLLVKILVALRIEPGPLDLWTGTLTTRPQRRSNMLFHDWFLLTLSSVYITRPWWNSRSSSKKESGGAGGRERNIAKKVKMRKTEAGK
jgi:hypothetical protein